MSIEITTIAYHCNVCGWQEPSAPSCGHTVRMVTTLNSERDITNARLGLAFAREARRKGEQLGPPGGFEALSHDEAVERGVTLPDGTPVAEVRFADDMPIAEPVTRWEENMPKIVVDETIPPGEIRLFNEDGGGVRMRYTRYAAKERVDGGGWLVVAEDYSPGKVVAEHPTKEAAEADALDRSLSPEFKAMRASPDYLSDLRVLQSIPGPDSVAHTFAAYPGRREPRDHHREVEESQLGPLGRVPHELPVLRSPPPLGRAGGAISPAPGVCSPSQPVVGPGASSSDSLRGRVLSGEKFTRNDIPERSDLVQEAVALLQTDEYMGHVAELSYRGRFIREGMAFMEEYLRRTGRIS